MFPFHAFHPQKKAHRNRCASSIAECFSDQTGPARLVFQSDGTLPNPFQSIGVNHDRGKVVAVADPQIINAVAVITLKVG